MNPFFRFQPLIVLLCGVVISGCARPSSEASDPQSDKLVAVRAVAIQVTDSVRTTVQPASVHAYFEVGIRPRVTGYVAGLNVDIGDVVSKGDVLATIAVPEMQKQLEVMDARLVRLKAEEQRADAGVRLAEAGIESAKAQLVQAESEVDRAVATASATEAEFQRVTDLVERQSIQPRVLDEVRSKRDADVAALKSVKSAIVAAQADVTVASAKKVAAEADLKASKADTRITSKQLEELVVMMDYASLKAPFDGIVTSRSIDPGDLVGESSVDTKSLLTISQINKMRVHVPVPERDAAWVSVGDEVQLTLPSFPDEKISATVTRTSQSLDQSTRTMLVEAELDNEDGKLLAGMFGQATIVLSENKTARLLPARSIRFDAAGNAFVYGLRDDNSVAITPIKTGSDDGNYIEVTDGLEADGRVVDAHLKRFVDGQKVSVLTE